MQLKTLKIALVSKYSDLPEHWIQDWLLFVIEKPATFLITDSDYELTDDELAKLDKGLQQMQAGTPLAYLIGKQAFWSLEFIVNEHTLIPRPDTEVLIEQVLMWVAANHKITKKNANKLLDLGTGTGCIAISLAHELAKQPSRLGKWQVTAIDFSKQALVVAKKNAGLNQIDNIEFLQSSWFDSLAKPVDKKDKFAIIVSNPPYIDKVDKHLDKLIAEPLTALVSDNQGLADIEKVVSGAGDFIQTGGLLAIEHGHAQGEQVRDIFKHHGFLDIQTVQDYGKNDRVTTGVFSK